MKNLFRVWLWWLIFVSVRCWAAEGVPLEKNVYIPYTELWKVFEQDDRGVFLPYSEFESLWRAAQQQTPEPAGPTGALLSEVEGVATVTQEVVQVTAAIRIDVLGKGWHEVALGLKDVTLTRAELDGQPARLKTDPKQGVVLLLEHADEAPKRHLLTLEFARGTVRSPGRNSFSFALPRAPVSRWEIRIPEPGVEVEVSPMVATTRLSAEGPGDTTRVQVFVGAAPSLNVHWTPKAEGARGMRALVEAQTVQQVEVERGAIRSRIQVDFRISRAEVDQLALRVPLDQKVVGVEDANVREWSVTEEEGGQRIDVRLFEPRKGTQTLQVELEQYGRPEPLRIPAVEALDVERQRGLLVVGLSGELRGEVAERTGLVQVDAGDLPGPLQKRTWEFTYRYAGAPPTLVLNLEVVQPEITANTLTVVRLQPLSLELETLAVLDVRRAGVFELHLLIPEEYDVRELATLPAAGGNAPRVEGHHLEDPEQGRRRLTVNLASRAMGEVRLRLLLHRELRQEALLTPTGQDVAYDLPVVRVTGDALRREEGYVAVAAPGYLHVEPGRVAGLRSVPWAEAVRAMGQGTSLPAGLAVRLTYAFTGKDPDLSLNARRRAPHITVGQLMTCRVEPGRVKYEVSLFTDVLYSGVSSIRVDVPAAVSERLQVLNSDLRPRQLSAATNLLEGMVAWNLERPSEFLGLTEIKLAWETPLDGLDIGVARDIALPRLIPREVDRAWGQIVLMKAGALDLIPASSSPGLTPVDPRHDLMRGRRYPDAAMAFEFHRDWSLTTGVTRYEPAELTPTGIERGLVRMVLTRGGESSVQALYQVRSTRQRLEIVLPAGAAFDSRPLRLNGRPVPLERGRDDHYYIPLTSQTAGDSFLLEVRYTAPMTGRALRIPHFEGDSAVQNVYLSVYLPDNFRYLGFRGAWNPELTWYMASAMSLRPRGNRPASWLLNWVATGLGETIPDLDTLPTDGQPLLFTALRPDTTGFTLHLVSMRERVFHGGLIVAGLLCGLLLVRVTMSRRILVLGALFSGAVLLAVFVPSLVRSAFSEATVGAGSIVLTLWIVYDLVIRWPRYRREHPRVIPSPPAPDPAPVQSPASGDHHEG